MKKVNFKGMTTPLQEMLLHQVSLVVANLVALSQRVPVKIMLDEQPQNPLAFVSGRTATVRIIEK